MFEKDNYFQNTANTVEETVKLFINALVEFGAISIQKRYTTAFVSDEMFSARRVSLPLHILYLIGNTFACDEVKLNWQPVTLAGTDESPCVDWNRVDVVESPCELKVYITKLISDWVDEILKLGDYSEEGKSEEDEIKDILHDMMFWDDRNPRWTAYDPNDKVNTV